MNNENQEIILRNLVISLSSVTFTLCIFLSFTIILFKKYKFISTRYILYLSLASSGSSTTYFIPKKENNNPICIFQAVYLTFFDWAVALWICVITFCLFWNVVLKKNITLKMEIILHIFVVSTSSFFAFLPFIKGKQVFGDSGPWCWIIETKWIIGIWYGPLFGMLFYVIIMYIWIIKSLYSSKPEKFYSRENEEVSKVKWDTAIKLSRYPLIFIILWIFPIINRITRMTGNNYFFLNVLHSICSPLQGTVNTIVFCIDERILSYCTLTNIQELFKSSSKIKPVIGKYKVQIDSDENLKKESIDSKEERTSLQIMGEENEKLKLILNSPNSPKNTYNSFSENNF